MKKESVGVFPGKFLPPHIGHVEKISESTQICDVLYVVISENKSNILKLCEDSGLPYLNAELRLSWLKEHFKNNSKIKFAYIDESLIPEPFHDNWKKELFDVCGGNIDYKFAGEEYKDYNEKYYSECKFIGYNRNDIEISGTMIRNEPEKYISYIIPEARSFFSNFFKEK